MLNQDNFPVSLSIVLDKDGFIKKDLIKFSNLQELDKYTILFESNVDVRKEFKNIIDDYLKNYQNLKNNGRICITFYDKQNNIRFLKVIYKKNQMVLDVNNSLKLIKESLNNNDVLKNLFIRKKYLLSSNEKDLLKLYFNYKNNKYKEMFIKSFYLRLLKSENKYLYMRSLVGVCNLLNKKNVIDKNIDSKKENILDEYLNSLIEKEDYEEIFNIYGLNVLEKISSDTVPIGIKKIKKK